MTNHAIYANDELENWAERKELMPEEMYLIEKYIRNSGRLIEAGTGGGRIALEIYRRNDKIKITAFDFVEEMIQRAKVKSRKIDFLVRDASDLSDFPDSSFDYAIYLQQIISLIPLELMHQSISESYRILKKEGIVIFSFLNYRGRWFNPILSLVVNIARFLKGEKWERQRLPWLKLSNKPNWNLLRKNQATTYWFEQEEIEALLRDIGFIIVETKTSRDINGHGAIGGLYVVCKK